MKKFVSISFVVILTSPLAQPQSPITREGPYWVRTISGVATGMPMDSFRLDTVGNVVLQGDSGSNKVSFKLRSRVKAPDAREAEALLRQYEAKVKTQSGWMYFNVTLPRNVEESPELTMFVPRSLRQV